MLATELFKVKNGLSASFMKIRVENAQHSYDLRKKKNLREIMLKLCTFLGARNWEIVSD